MRRRRSLPPRKTGLCVVTGQIDRPAARLMTTITPDCQPFAEQPY